MKVIHIILKDLKVMLRDKKAMALSILMPIILTSILGAALGSNFATDMEKNKLEVAVVKQYDVDGDTQRFMDLLNNNLMTQGMDGTQMMEIEKATQELSGDEMFTEQFLENEEIGKIINYRVMDEARARRLLEEKKLSAIILLPEDFVYDIYVNFFTPFRNEMEIKIMGHPDQYISGQIVEGIMKGFTDTLSTIIIGKNVLVDVAMEAGLGNQVFEEMGFVIEGMTENVESFRVEMDDVKVKGQQPISSYQYYAAAMTVMFILFTAASGGKLLLEEKDNITYQRMVMAGITKWQIVTGKFFTIITFALIQISTMIVFTQLAFGVNWGNPLLVALITLAAVFAVGGLGTFISALTYRSGNYKAADVFQAAFVHVMAFLGGSFIPIEVLPQFMQSLSNLTLNGLANKAYQRVMLGNGIDSILSLLLGLVAMGILFVAIGIIILNREERWKHAKYHQTQTHEIKG